MALTKEKKAEVIAEVTELLESSKLTVVADYRGTSVKQMQELRRQAKSSATVVKVVKNRLVKKALEQSGRFKSVDSSPLTSQLLYAFNSDDEVAPAQALANFAKTGASVQFVGAITADGQFLSAEDTAALASLPSKEQLRSMLVGTLSAPLSGFASVLSGNVRGVLGVLSARAEALEA